MPIMKSVFTQYITLSINHYKVKQNALTVRAFFIYKREYREDFCKILLCKICYKKYKQFVNPNAIINSRERLKKSGSFTALGEETKNGLSARIIKTTRKT